MANLLSCDASDCTRTVDVDYPFGWLKLERLGDFAATLGERSEFHYCSMAHAHKHTYLLISGDNGK